MAEEKENERSEDASDSVGDSSKNEAPTVVCDVVKGLDANQYATKKTVAQGMLDIALMTSNAAQLKYVLQVGPQHEFYTLLIVLISISIVLQMIAHIFYQYILLVEGPQIYKEVANWLYRVSIALMLTALYGNAIWMMDSLESAVAMQQSKKNKLIKK